MDYQGQAVSYGDLSPGDYKEINTFQTHPWIFVNKETGVRYVHNNRYLLDIIIGNNPIICNKLFLMNCEYNRNL